MKLLLSSLVMILMLACSKSKQDPPELPAWLEAKKADYTSCTCLTGFRQGIYNGQVVYEIYLYDPLCSGINVVYTADGTILFLSSDFGYPVYQELVTNVRVVWRCEDN